MMSDLELLSSLTCANNSLYKCSGNLVLDGSFLLRGRYARPRQWTDNMWCLEPYKN
jgi:hypothetical protein